MQWIGCELRYVLHRLQLSGARSVMPRMISFLILLGLSQLAHAEQGCPDGLYPGGAAPGQICIPMPGYGINANGGGEVQAVEPRWATRWGAVAIGEDSRGS